MDKTLVELVGDMQILEPTPWDYDHYRGDGPYESFVEREVRNRIEARGWKWSVGCTYGAFHYSASVRTVLEQTDWGNTWAGSHEALGGTPAYAVITAYIAALEALKADGIKTD